MARAPLFRRSLLLGLLAAGSAAARPPSRFTFTPPMGWTDLLENQREIDITTLHPGLAVAMLRDDWLALAADLNPGSDGKNSFMQALGLPSGLEITPQTLPDIRKAIVDHNTQDDVAPPEVRTLEIIDIGGADVARIVWAVKEPSEGDEMRMAYIFSGGDEPGAMIVYGTSASAFEATRPLLEASARATGGVVPTPRSRRLFYKSLPYLQIAGVVGLLGVLLVSRRRAQMPPAVTTPAAAASGPEKSDVGSSTDER